MAPPKTRGKATAINDEKLSELVDFRDSIRTDAAEAQNELEKAAAQMKKNFLANFSLGASSFSAQSRHLKLADFLTAVASSSNAGSRSISVAPRRTIVETVVRKAGPAKLRNGMRFPSAITPKVGGPRGDPVEARAPRLDELAFSVDGSPIVMTAPSSEMTTLQRLISADEAQLSPATRDLVSNVKTILRRKQNESSV